MNSTESTDLQIRSRTLRRRVRPVRAAAWAVRGVAVVVSVALMVVANRPGGGGSPERARRQPEGWYRRVGQVNLFQFVVIAAIVVVCLLTDVPQLVAPLVCLVVGLHFFPLTGLFDQPEYRATAIGLCVAAVLALLVLAVGPGAEAARLVVGTLAALTLWGTAVRLSLPRGGPR